VTILTNTSFMVVELKMIQGGWHHTGGENEINMVFDQSREWHSRDQFF
jgi:hypothetical protein